MDALGAYAIVWQTGDSIEGSQIRLQRFDASGQATLPGQLVGAPISESISPPAVALNAAGDTLVVAWTELLGFGPQYNSVYARRFGPGFPAEDFFFVADGGNVQFVRASADAAGRFAVLWGERNSVASNLIPKATVRLYDTSGAVLDTLFAVEADDLAMDADSDLVAVASRRIGQSLLAGSTLRQNVIAQRFQGVEPVDLTVTHQIQSVPSSIPGDIVYKVRVSNMHPPVDLGVAPVVQNAIGAASEVVVETGIGFASAGGTGWTCSAPNNQFGNPHPQICRYSQNLAPGQTASDLLVTQAALAFSFPGIKSHAFANQFDPNLTNNTVQTSVPAP
ncbi:MAG: hypothetical protein ACT4QA_05630 [Panacagrimonas sp.]